MLEEVPTPQTETLLSHTTTDPLPSLGIHWPSPQLPTSAFSPFDNPVGGPTHLQNPLRPIMCFAGSLLISPIILFPMLAPLPSLTSSRWALSLYRGSCSLSGINSQLHRWPQPLPEFQVWILKS